MTVKRQELPILEDMTIILHPNTRLTIIGERVPYTFHNIDHLLPDDQKATTLVEVRWHYNNGEAVSIIKELSSDDAPEIINEWTDG